MRALLDNSEQGTLEWRIARIPYVTASCVGDVMAKGEGKSRESYMTRKICELLTGKPVNGYKSRYMQNGNDYEDVGRQLYTAITGNEVEQVGFAYLPNELLGASTDGLVDEDGMIEIKNVLPSEQIRIIRLGTINGKYMKQMQTNLYVFDRKWCDYVSVSLGDEDEGELPDEYKVKIVRVYRDEKMIEEIRSEVKKFHDDKQKIINILNEGKHD